MLKRLKINFVYLLFPILVWWGFGGLVNTFYQQDEWYGLGDILVNGPGAIFLNVSLLQIILGQGRILSDALIYFLIGQFPFNITPVALFAIFFHIINTILVFILIKKIIKKAVPSILASLFFSFNGVAVGAVTWAASGTGTLPATTLIILGLFCYLKFIETNQNKWLIWLFSSLYLSLYFKEIGIFLFIFLPAFHLIFFKYHLNKFFRQFLIFIIFFIASSSMTLVQFQSIPVEKDLFLTGATPNSFLTLVSRALIYPLTSFSLVLVPSGAFFDFAKHLTWIYYPFLPPAIYDLVAQSVVLDGLAVLLSLTTAFILFMFFKGSLNKKYAIFFVGFILFSVLPYIIIGKTGSYLESRYYYLASLGWAVLFGLLLKNSKFFLSFFIVLILIHALIVRGEIQKQTALALERKKILAEILTIKPKLDQKTIFFVRGDRNFYVGEGNTMPWQQGLGYTLLVWYDGQNKAPEELKALINKQYLWGIGEQGYQQINGVGFGYFWDEALLKKEALENDIDEDNIVSLYYNSKDKKLNEKSI